MKMLNQFVDCLQKYSLFMGDTICFTGWLLLPTRCGIPTVALRLQNRWGFFMAFLCSNTWRFALKNMRVAYIRDHKMLTAHGNLWNPFLEVSVKGRRKAEGGAFLDGDEIRMRWGMSVCSISVAVQNFTWTLFHYWFFWLIPWLPCFVSIFLCCLGVCHWFHSLGSQ